MFSVVQSRIFDEMGNIEEFNRIYLKNLRIEVVREETTYEKNIEKNIEKELQILLREKLEEQE